MAGTKPDFSCSIFSCFECFFKSLSHKVSLFSGKDFTVDAERGLNGICDFLIRGFPQQLEIERPVIVIVEAKKVDLTSGLGQVSEIARDDRKC